MPKNLLLVLALSVIILTATLTVLFGTSADKTPKSEVDQAINQAKHTYSQKKFNSEDLQIGPCLSDALMPGWVLDIAHNPRQEIDDLPQNQCPAFREGRAVHFVELDPEGNFIRAR